MRRIHDANNLEITRDIASGEASARNYARRTIFFLAAFRPFGEIPSCHAEIDKENRD